MRCTRAVPLVRPGATLRRSLLSGPLCMGHGGTAACSLQRGFPPDAGRARACPTVTMWLCQPVLPTLRMFGHWKCCPLCNHGKRGPLLSRGHTQRLRGLAGALRRRGGCAQVSWGHEFGLNLYTFLRSARLCCLQVPRQAGTPKGSCPLSCQKAPHRRRGACRAEGPPGPLQTRGGGRGL